MKRFFAAVIQAKDVGQNLFYLVYVSNEVDLYITANGEGKEITVTVRCLYFSL